MSIRMAPPLFLIILIFVIPEISGSYWAVNYGPSHICALMDSSVIISCNYTYPTGFEIKTAFWTKSEKNKPHEDHPDLSKDPEYSQRLQYLGDKQQNCTIRLSDVTEKDEYWYYFRFTTNVTTGKWTGVPGVSLTVTDLQVESPERVTEGDSVRLTCKSSCNLTDQPTFIWYRNSQPLPERRGRNNELLLQSVRREDAGRYRCAVHGHTLTSPDVNLNVTYPPRNVSVSISGSAVIVSGHSVILSCSSDSNPPAEISWFKEEMFVETGGMFILSNISSDDSGEYKCKSLYNHEVKYSDPVTLNVMYPPRNISVFINGSAEVMSGGSVSLSCISDSNPPAEISWFKENQSSSVGSGQSFSAVQSGRFYCEAHNPHGSQRSDAVTVTVKGRKFLYAVAGVIGGLGCLIFALIVVIMKKKNRSDDIKQDQDDLYANLAGRASTQGGNPPKSDQIDTVYSLVTHSRVLENQTKGRTSDPEDEEEIQYVTVQHHRNESENEYLNFGLHQHDAAMRSGHRIMEDQSVIYSTVK